MKLTKTLSILLIPMLLTMATLPLANIAYADPPAEVSGTFLSLVSSDRVDRVTEGGIRIRTQMRTWEMTGDIAGLLLCDERTIIDLSTLKGTYHALCTFTGTVLNSDPGEARFLGECTVENSGTLFASSDCAFIMFKGTDGLTGVHSVTQGGFTGDPADLPFGRYSGWAHFDHRE